MEEYVKELIVAFSQKSNPSDAFFMKKYMKNNFDFFGIKSQLRREISRPFLKKENLPDYLQIRKIIHELWKEPERELQYFGMELLLKYQMQFEEKAHSFFEFMITNKSWWDTVDFIATKIVGSYFSQFPELKETVSEKWNMSGNLWLQRTSILFQLKYKEKTDTLLLKKYILQHADSKEFFLRKAIGWALREFSKTNPSFVFEFVDKYGDRLSSLSKKEALRIIAD